MGAAKKFIKKKEIRSLIKKIAEQINEYYLNKKNNSFYFIEDKNGDRMADESFLSEKEISINNEPVVFICVLKAAAHFFSFLLREVKLNAIEEFVYVQSFFTGNLRLKEPKLVFQSNFFPVIMGKNVLIVDTIIESGKTIRILKKEVDKYKPKSVRVATLI